MRCASCGSDITAGSTTCETCGALPNSCPNCGTANPETSFFCGHCGGQLRRRTADPAKHRRDERAEILGSQAERRQVSVMFCDLVGSTALSEVLDPEDLSNVIIAYRGVVRDLVEGLGGYIARYIGDGLLIFFGYPYAHDNDAVRAVRVGLRIIEEIRALAARPELPITTPLSTRIGIHTGVAVIGDLGRGNTRERDGVIGETPNIAARIQSLASPDTLLISGTTLELVEAFFDCASLGTPTLKGISKNVSVYRVVAERDRRLGFSGSAISDRLPLIDRKVEWQALAQHWQRAVAGCGSAVALSGEPGVGKSRLARAFARWVGEHRHGVLACMCSSENSGSAFFPVAELLRREMGLGQAAGEEEFRKLAVAVTVANLPSDAVGILAAFLSLDVPGGQRLPRLSPEGLRQRTMECLLAWLKARAELGALLLIVEDVHWADASTREWLGYVMEHIAASRIMVLLSVRSEFGQLFAGKRSVAEIPLGRFVTEDLAEMLRGLTKDNGFPPALRRPVIERSDGNPLFLEELVKTVREVHSSHVEDAPQTLEMPTSLRGMLEARLDRLPAGKMIAQIASVIGREFPSLLLRRISPYDDALTAQGLRELVDAEILFTNFAAPSRTYHFKHSLLHEAAYQSLLRSTRRQYHETIARTYVKDFPQVAETQPEVVASQFEMAGLADESAKFWFSAGTRAHKQSAYHEAAAHFRSALQQIEKLPPSSERLHDEIKNTVALGAALIPTRGFAAPEVRSTYSRASELCEGAGNPRELLSALGGLLTFYQVRGPLPEALALAERILNLAKETGDTALLVSAHRRLGWCQFSIGNFRIGRDHLLQALTLYQPGETQPLTGLDNWNPIVVGLINLAWVEWFVGNVDSAVDYASRARTLSREVGQPISLAYALCMSAAVHQGLGDAEVTFDLASQTIELAKKNAFPYWAAWATVLQGWAIARRGAGDAGLAQMMRGLVAYEATGARLFKPHSLVLIAEICGALDRYDQGLAFIDDGLASAAEAEIHFCDAELYRVRGDLLRAKGEAGPAAEAYGTAVDIAAAQGAEMLRRRAEASLAALR